MSAFPTSRPLARSAPASVAQAAGQTVISGLYKASNDVGDVADRIDCIGIAHRVATGGPVNLDAAGYRLSADLLDKLLVQQACNREDLVTLCLVAAERMGAVEDSCEQDVRPIADAVATALLNVAGFILAEQGADLVRRLPAALRDRAVDCLDNYVWEPVTSGEEN